MYRIAFGLSFALHLVFVACMWNAKYIPTERKISSVKKPLEVRPISEKELIDKEVAAEIEARKRLQNTTQVVHSEEQLKNELLPDSKTEKIFLSKTNQRVDRNTRSARIGAYKNILDEGLEGGDELKKKAGADAVKAAKSAKQIKPEAFDAKNLFALATDYEKTDEGKADAVKTRMPSSVLNGPSGGKKGQGLSATDDFLDGVSVGANTMLNTQEFKYYSFYERIRSMLVDRWRSRIRREIFKARQPTSEGSRLALGSKITKLQVKIGPTGDINSVEKVGISGIETFDQAAEISFREAAPFPHPPKEMLKDEELTIMWDFVVVVEDASLVEFKVDRSL
jgi:outer membrane biosynthesis protein TonB